MAVEYILKNSLLRRTLDNVTVVMIAFKNFKRAVFGEDRPQQAVYDDASSVERTIDSIVKDEQKSTIYQNYSLAKKKEGDDPYMSNGNENSSTAFN